MDKQELAGILTAEIMRPGIKKPVEIKLTNGTTIKAIVKGMHVADAASALPSFSFIDTADHSEKSVSLGDIESVSSSLQG